MKKSLIKHKEKFRLIACIPAAAIIQVFPINAILLTIQLTCFGIMWYIGWNYE